MTLVTISPTTSAHDAWESGTGVMTLDGEVRVTAGTAWAGLFLASVAVPNNPTTLTATLYYKATNNTHDDPAFNWHCEDTDNASIFSGSNSNISNRPRTTAFTNEVTTGIGTTNWRTVNISTAIDEVVSRAGWASGNNIAIIADGQSGVDLWLRSYDAGGDVWYVEIDYTTGSPATIALDTLSAAASAVTLAAVTPGAVSLLLDTLTTYLNAIQLTVTPGAVSLLLDTPTAVLETVSLDVAPGVVVIAVDTLNGGLSAVSLAVTPGAAAVLLSSLSGALEVVDLAVTPGGVVVVLTTHTATLAAVALSVEGIANIVILNTLSGAIAAVPLVVAPGEYVAALNTLIGLLQVMDLTVGQGIGLSTLSAALSAVTLDVLPGEYVAQLATLAPALEAVGLAVIPGAVTIDMAVLTALIEVVAINVTGAGSDAVVLLSSLTGALSAVEMGVIPGDMVIDLQTLAAALDLTDLLVYLLLGCAMSGVLARSSATAGDFAALLIQTGDMGGCNR